jgi:hypothetical protein
MHISVPRQTKSPPAVKLELDRLKYVSLFRTRLLQQFYRLLPGLG